MYKFEELHKKYLSETLKALNFSLDPSLKTRKNIFFRITVYCMSLDYCIGPNSSLTYLFQSTALMFLI